MPRTLPASFHSAMGRQQSNNIAFYAKSRKEGYKPKSNYIPLNDRVSKEWDIRIDLTNGLTATAVVERARSFKDAMVYGLVSGLEFGKSRNDRPSNRGWLQEEEELHVHICLVTKNPVKRLEALGMFRPTKTGGEYAVPRKTEHTYAGWRLHHCKDATKVESSDPIWEYGTLPMDAMNEDVGLKIYYMVRMYGSDIDRQALKGYTDLGLAKKNRIRMENKRKAVDDIEQLRARLAKAEEELAKRN